MADGVERVIAVSLSEAKALKPSYGAFASLRLTTRTAVTENQPHSILASEGIRY
jgi:hypothetical protein